MIRMILRVWKFLWRYSFFRFGAFHIPAGALNYTVAFLLFWYVGVDKYAATTAGHFIHVTIGFFYDRDVTFRVQDKRSRRALVTYWFNDVLSFTSILLTMYLLVDFYGVHLLLAEYMAWPEEWVIAAVRAVPAMIIGTAITYGLNKIWTFNEANSQPKLL